MEKSGKLKITFGSKTIYDERTSNNNVHSTLQINPNVVRENGYNPPSIPTIPGIVYDM